MKVAWQNIDTGQSPINFQREKFFRCIFTKPRVFKCRGLSAGTLIAAFADLHRVTSVKTKWLFWYSCQPSLCHTFSTNIWMRSAGNNPGHDLSQRRLSSHLCILYFPVYSAVDFECYPFMMVTKILRDKQPTAVHQRVQSNLPGNFPDASSRHRLLENPVRTFW